MAITITFPRPARQRQRQRQRHQQYGLERPQRPFNMTARPPTPEPELLVASQYRELHAIVNRQISEPASFAAYINQIDEILRRISVDSPHSLTPEASHLFITLYRAIAEESAGDVDGLLSATHFAVATSIMQRLRLQDGRADRPDGPVLCLYALSEQSVPRQVVSRFLGEIRKCLVNNKHRDSFGVLLNVGLSTETKVMCCVFGSRTPETFTAPTELVGEGISLPVLVFKNWISNSATAPSEAPPTTWINRPVGQPVEINLSGQSVGPQGDVENAGSFGFYGHAQGVMYGFMAAHCAPQVKPGSIIVSPSARELTGRLKAIARYTKFDLDPIKVKEQYESQVQSMLNTGLWSEDSKNGYEIMETYLETGKDGIRKIILNGPEFGRVVGTLATPKTGVLERHNHRLDQQGTKNFDLPYDDPRLAEGREGCSRVEWCCFEVSKERFGRNRLNSDSYEDNAVRGIDLLKPDMVVFKIGRTTGQTSGTVNGCILQQWKEDPGQEPQLTMEIAVVSESKFADCGDSGSLVAAEDVATDEVAPYGVGMVIGKDCSQQLAIVTPLWAILEDVEETLHLGIDFYTEN